MIKGLKYAISLGYRHIDTAWLYQNEDVIGKVLKEVIGESKGKLKREDFFLTSKVWNTHHRLEFGSIFLVDSLIRLANILVISRKFEKGLNLNFKIID